MKLYLVNHSLEYETLNIIKIFFPSEQVIIANVDEPKTDDYIITRIKSHKTKTSALIYISKQGRVEKSRSHFENTTEDYKKHCEFAIGKALFIAASKICGFKPPWGILTGIRPIKLLRDTENNVNSKSQVENIFQNDYLVNPEKLKLCMETAENEEKILSLSKPNSFSLYISIPFCPSRCAYCSFVSHDIEKAAKLVPKYVELLCEEIKQTAKIAEKLGLRLETIYMGGGTPTSLNAMELKKIFDTVKSCFSFSTLREYTVECGRPDTITRERLEAVLEGGAGRISINPQTMDNDILELIGRNHTAQDIIIANELAKSLSVPSINMDLIAGLPNDTSRGFENSLKSVLEMQPQAITVHTFAIKRSSTLVYSGNAKYNAEGGEVNDMLKISSDMLHKSEYNPYYLYRQKNMAGNLENVGWSKKGHEGLYNVYIMEETHTILSVGAGGVTKLRQPNGSRIERIFNFKYPYEYISRFEQIIDKKKMVFDFYEQFNWQEKD